MSAPTRGDSLAADVLDVAGNIAALLGRSFGRDAAGTVAMVVIQLAAEAIRRGVASDHIIATLKHIEPLSMPWESVK